MFAVEGEEEPAKKERKVEIVYRLQELEEENIRLDCTIARQVQRITRESQQSRKYFGNKPINQYEQHLHETHGGSLKNHKCDVVLTMKELQEEKWRLDSSIVHQVQNTVRQMTQFFNAKSMAMTEKKFEVWRDEVNTGILSRAEEPSSESVLKCDENSLKIGIACKIETVAYVKNLDSKDTVEVLDIYTCPLDGMKINDGEVCKDVNSLKIWNVGRRSNKLYLAQKCKEEERHQRKLVTFPEARAALTCLNSYLDQRDLTQEKSMIKDQFGFLVQEELLSRLEDENIVLDVAVARAAQRSWHDRAWSDAL